MNNKLHSCALGMSMGLLLGLSALVMGLLAHCYSYGVAFVTSMQTLYIGYEPTITGAFLGGLQGFVHGFIVGFLIAWLYNMFAGKCCKKEC